MTYDEALKRAIQLLKDHNIEDPSYEAGLLLSWTLNTELSHIYSHQEANLTSEQKQAFFANIKRRSLHEPFAYITNERCFMGLRFFVNEHVLIPRDDTETLVEAALYALAKDLNCFNQKMFRLPQKNSYRILDVGTGSGCIAISLAKSSESFFVDAIDISNNALEIATKNAKHHGVIDRINFINLDYTKLNLSSLSKYDLIISNPPYIPLNDIDGLMSSVKDYEPITALEAGQDGLTFYRALANSTSLLFDGGILMVECGYNQAKEVREIFEFKGLNSLTLTDLSNTPRVVAAIKL